MKIKSAATAFPVVLIGVTLSACSTYTHEPEGSTPALSSDYASRIPQTIDTTEKVIVVDPRVHVWGAYDNGSLVKAGLASAGASYCPDLGKPCRTEVGTFRIHSLGTASCESSIFPIPNGGAPMPYCMYFNNGQALHGVSDNEVVEGNVSHGCVRMHVSDAEWVRYNFASIGTKVIIKPY